MSICHLKKIICINLHYIFFDKFLSLIKLFVQAYISGDTTDFWAIAQYLGIYYEVLELLEKQEILEAKW